MTYVLYQQVTWVARSGIVSDFRKNILKLPPTYFTNTDEIPVPMLYCYSPSIIKKPSDWRDWIHITGFWFLEGAKDYTPSERLASFLNNSSDTRPIIYIGFGSIVVSNPDEMLEAIVEGVRKANVRAILSKGW
jgi:sterol 3beta-glucosyltransferase